MPDFIKAIEDQKREETQPLMDMLSKTHAFHPRMILDTEFSWLVKKAMGAENFNKLFDVRSLPPLHAAAARPARC